MKKIMMMMALAAIALFSVTACGDDDDDNGGTKKSAVTLSTPKYKNDAIKVKVPNVETTLDGKAIRLKQLELTEGGRYLLAYEQLEENGSRMTRADALTEYLMGFFEKDGDGYKLVKFGHIAFSIEGNHYMLTLIPTGGKEIQTEVTKLATIPASELTNYLCRTWTITNTRIQGNTGDVKVAKDFPGKCDMSELIAYAESKGITVKEKPDASKTIVDGVTFTASQSYIVNYTSGATDVGTWHWTQQSTGTGNLAYDWDGNHMGFEAIQHTGVVTFEGSQCKLALPISDNSMTLEVVYTMQ